MKILTVFTPTFNRANTLVRLYESLCRQTSDAFEWLIIDDGGVKNPSIGGDNYPSDKLRRFRPGYRR